MWAWEATFELLSAESDIEGLVSRVCGEVSPQLLARMLKIIRVVIKMVHDLTVDLLFLLGALLINLVELNPNMVSIPP